MATTARTVLDFQPVANRPKMWYVAYLLLWITFSHLASCDRHCCWTSDPVLSLCQATAVTKNNISEATGRVPPTSKLEGFRPRDYMGIFKTPHLVVANFDYDCGDGCNTHSFGNHQPLFGDRHLIYSNIFIFDILHEFECNKKKKRKKNDSKRNLI